MSALAPMTTAPRQHPSLRMLDLAEAFAAVAPRGVARHFPGARGRHWARLRGVVRGRDPLAQAGLAAYEQGAIEDFGQLQVAALLVALLGDHPAYEACLALHDATLAFAPDTDRAFVGRGGGTGSLPVFRRLGQRGAARFEKIYQKDGAALWRMQAAMQVLVDHPVVRVPALRDQHSGSRLVAVEAEWCPRGPTPAPELGCALARRLAEIPAHALPCDLATLLELQRPLRRLARRLDAPLSAALHAAEARVGAMPLVFSHGDLSPANHDTTGLVWDWDAAGLRPYGYDAAYACRGQLADAEAVFEWSARHVERPDSAASDRLGFVFFTLSFSPDLALPLAARLPGLLAAAP